MADSTQADQPAANDGFDPERVQRHLLTALNRGDGIDIDAVHYDRLRAYFATLGIHTETGIFAAIRAGFREVVATEIKQRVDGSYSGLQDGQTLFQCRWRSASFNKVMYAKFALLDGDRIELFTFHESTE